MVKRGFMSRKLYLAKTFSSNNKMEIFGSIKFTVEVDKTEML